jgi:hypothetical protein
VTRDDGAAALLLLGVLLLGLALTFPLALGMGAAVHATGRAAAAADLTALAVIAGSALAGGGGVPDQAAGQAVAQANGADLVTVDDAGWPTAVTVTVRVPVTGPLAHLRRSVQATATAHLVPP